MSRVEGRGRGSRSRVKKIFFRVVYIYWVKAFVLLKCVKTFVHDCP